jgi:hypothetical protein
MAAAAKRDIVAKAAAVMRANELVASMAAAKRSASG